MFAVTVFAVILSLIKNRIWATGMDGFEESPETEEGWLLAIKKLES